MTRSHGMRRLLSVMTAVLITGAGVVTVAAPAQASPVSCYGDYCSGLSPMDTGCAADAVTVAAKQLDDGRLELRWSPTCQTNWARYEQYPFGSFASEVPLALVAVQDTGYTQSINWFEGDNVQPVQPGTFYTPMIYSPVHSVYAAVALDCGDATIFSAVMDCALNGQERTDAV